MEVPTSNCLSSALGKLALSFRLLQAETFFSLAFFNTSISKFQIKHIFDGCFVLSSRWKPLFPQSSALRLRCPLNRASAETRRKAIVIKICKLCWYAFVQLFCWNARIFFRDIFSRKSCSLAFRSASLRLLGSPRLQAGRKESLWHYRWSNVSTRRIAAYCLGPKL